MGKGKAYLDGTKFGFIMSEVMKERHHQDELRDNGRFDYTCADIGLGNLDRLACIDEESGEVARECLTLRGLVHDRDISKDEEKLRTELIQVIALCVAWLESPMNTLPVV